MYKSPLSVGVVVCHYNQSEYFKECLSGLLSQTIRPKFIFIVDDGSTDGSWEKILKELSACVPYLSLDPKKSQHMFESGGINFCLIQLDKNYGPSYARNAALKYLVDKVDVIAIADADDIYYGDKIERSLRILDKYPEIGLVYSDYDIRNMKDGQIRREYKEIYSYRRLSQECIVSNNSVFRANLINVVGGYDPQVRFGEDYDLWLRMSEVSGIYHIPETLYCYRLTGKNATVVTPPEQFAKHVAYVQQKAAKRRNQRAQ